MHYLPSHLILVMHGKTCPLKDSICSKVVNKMTIQLYTANQASGHKEVYQKQLPCISLWRHWSTNRWQYCTSAFKFFNSSKSVLYLDFNSRNFLISKNSSSLIITSPSSLYCGPVKQKIRPWGYKKKFHAQFCRAWNFSCSYMFKCQQLLAFQHLCAGKIAF